MKKSLLTFSETISIINGNPYVRPPDDVLNEIFEQAGRDTSPIPIKGTINGAAFHQSLVRYMGDWRLYVNIWMATAAKLEFSKSVTEVVGQQVEFAITFDPSPPTYEMSPFLEKALKDHPRTWKAWGELTPGRQKEVLRYFSFLKSDEARERNLERLLKVLGGEEGRFMARDWKDGK
jgi:hypothetical protein